MWMHRHSAHVLQALGAHMHAGEKGVYQTEAASLTSTKLSHALLKSFVESQVVSAGEYSSH